MKQKKASAELRKKALELFTTGVRFETVAKKLGIDRTVVWRWMSLFDENDLRWLDPSWRRKTSIAERIEIVKDYLEFKSYHAVAKTWGVSASSVRQYVLNMANYGHPSLRHRVTTQDKAMPNRKIKSALMDPDAELPKDLEASHKMIRQQQIAFRSLLESIDNNLGGTEGSKKKLSFLTKQLLAHIEQGYPLPSPAMFLKLQGAPIIDVLESLDRECEKIRSSAIASNASKRHMTDDTES